MSDARPREAQPPAHRAMVESIHMAGTTVSFRVQTGETGAPLRSKNSLAAPRASTSKCETRRLRAERREVGGVTSDGGAAAAVPVELERDAVRDFAGCTC